MELEKEMAKVKGRLNKLKNNYRQQFASTQMDKIKEDPYKTQNSTRIESKSILSLKQDYPLRVAKLAEAEPQCMKTMEHSNSPDERLNSFRTGTISDDQYPTSHRYKKYITDTVMSKINADKRQRQKQLWHANR